MLLLHELHRSSQTHGEVVDVGSHAYGERLDVASGGNSVPAMIPVARLAFFLML